jgi:hypothetical protein
LRVVELLGDKSLHHDKWRGGQIENRVYDRAARRRTTRTHEDRKTDGRCEARPSLLRDFSPDILEEPAPQAARQQIALSAVKPEMRIATVSLFSSS